MATYANLARTAGFAVLDGMIAQECYKIAKGARGLPEHTNLAALLMQTHEQAAMKQELVTGRQYLMIIYERYRTQMDRAGARIDYRRLEAVTLHNDDIEKLVLDWNNALMHMSGLPDAQWCWAKFEEEVKKSKVLKSSMDRYYEHESYATLFIWPPHPDVSDVH